MNGTALSESALRLEIEDFRRQIGATSSRTILNTVRADVAFSSAAYGFRSVLSALSNSLSFPDGMTAKDGFEASLYKLEQDAMGVYSPDEPIGAAALAKIKEIFPALKDGEDAPPSNSLATEDRNMAREAILRFAAASVRLTVAQIAQKGVDVDFDEVDEWLVPLMRRLDPIPTRGMLRERYALRRA